MRSALTLAADENTAGPVRDLWRQAAAFETQPSMEAQGYPPHLTFAIGDGLDPQALAAAAGEVFDRALTLTFTRLAVFEGSPPVLWAAPEEAGLLSRLHTILHRRIDRAGCEPLYRPGSWVPHLTLATAIDPAREAEARAFAWQEITPFRLRFDRVEWLTLPPIDVVGSLALDG